MGDQTTRDALARSIVARVARFRDEGLDELRVIDEITTRLELGFYDYGPLDLSTPRKWIREATEERLDAAIYEACDSLAREDRERAALRADVAAEIHDVDLGGEGG